MSGQRSFPIRLVLVVAVVVSVLVMLIGSVVASPAMASFGVETFMASAENQSGAPVTQAGSHPYAFTTEIEFDHTLTNENGLEVPNASARDVHVALPPGLIGNPTVIPACTQAQFQTPSTERQDVFQECPNSSAIGVATVHTSPPGSRYATFPVFNLEPPPGYPAAFGFTFNGVPVMLTPHIREDGTYGLTVDSTNTSQALPIYGVRVTIWGVPYESVHDAERGSCAEELEGRLCPVGGAPKAYLTLPSSCTGPLTTTVTADSWQEPGSYLPDGEPDLADPAWGGVASVQPELDGCGGIAFSPATEAQSTTDQTGSPTGFRFNLNVNDEGLTNPTGVAQSDLKKAVVTLPEGFTVNPSAGAGLGACSLGEYETESLRSQPSEGCPEDSKLGTIEIESPLVEGKIDGSVYLAASAARGEVGKNPFNSLLAIYIVARSSEKGVFIKSAGHVEPNPVTGQLVTTFENLPQLPFSHFRFSFYQGQTSPLVSPALCGSYTAEAKLYPWSDPEKPLEESSTFQVNSGISGGPCPSGGTPPFSPQLSAGTLSNSAGAYSQFDLLITRNDTEQEITGFSSQLPPGLTGNLTGVQQCSEAQVQQAREQTGTEAESNPACPAGSEIGHTIAEAGVGAVLAQTPGKLYLGGPFEGAPFSVVSITSAKVGPFDLGTVVVHLPLDINPTTAAVTIPSGPADQIPHIIKGIVVHLRAIHVYIDRQNFMINPTGCEPQTLSATVIGGGADPTNTAGYDPVTVANHFQATNCGALKFEPKFSVSTSGKTSKADGASLSVKLAYPTGALGKDANIAKVKVELPVQLPSRLTTLQKACTKAQFDTNPAGCPAASVVGHAKAVTPILPVPLEGPAYFVSNGGEAFPNLIIVLQGYGVTIDLVGDTYISKAGITSSTFKTVPDQPVQSFELTLPEGPYSALAANGDLCALTKTVLVKKKTTVKIHGRKRTETRKVKQTEATSMTMPTEFIAQNGATIHQTTPVSVTGCPKSAGKASKKKARKKKGKGKKSKKRA